MGIMQAAPLLCAGKAYIQAFLCTLHLQMPTRIRHPVSARPVLIPPTHDDLHHMSLFEK